MPLHTLQLSYRPHRHRVPQALKIVFWALVSWGLVGLVAWLIGLAV